MLYLSQIYTALNERERRRLERQLGVILRHRDRSHETYRSIVKSIRHHFKLNQCSWISILLKNGNPIRLDSLPVDERSEIEQSPMLIVDGIAHLPAEFIEAWKFDFQSDFQNRFKSIENKNIKSSYNGSNDPAILKSSDSKNQNQTVTKSLHNKKGTLIIEESSKRLLLFSALHRLKLSERQAYLSWLKRYTDACVIQQIPYQSVTMQLYLLIRHLRILTEEWVDLEGEGPWHLQDIFAELWQNPPLYWYQKEVLPFYQCLHDLEKELFRNSKLKLSSSIQVMQSVYYGLRTGRLCIVEEEQGFGEKLKPMLYRTIDFEISSVETNYNSRQESAQQDLLF